MSYHEKEISILKYTLFKQSTLQQHQIPPNQPKQNVSNHSDLIPFSPSDFISTINRNLPAIQATANVNSNPKSNQSLESKQFRSRKIIQTDSIHSNNLTIRLKGSNKIIPHQNHPNELSYQLMRGRLGEIDTNTRLLSHSRSLQDLKVFQPQNRIGQLSKQLQNNNPNNITSSHQQHQLNSLSIIESPAIPFANTSATSAINCSAPEPAVTTAHPSEIKLEVKPRIVVHSIHRSNNPSTKSALSTNHPINLEQSSSTLTLLQLPQSQPQLEKQESKSAEFAETSIIHKVIPETISQLQLPLNDVSRLKASLVYLNRQKVSNSNHNNNISTLPPSAPIMKGIYVPPSNVTRSIVYSSTLTNLSKKRSHVSHFEDTATKQRNTKCNQWVSSKRMKQLESQSQHFPNTSSVDEFAAATASTKFEQQQQQDLNLTSSLASTTHRQQKFSMTFSERSLFPDQQTEQFQKTVYNPSKISKKFRKQLQETLDKKNNGSQKLFIPSSQEKLPIANFLEDEMATQSSNLILQSFKAPIRQKHRHTNSLFSDTSNEQPFNNFQFELSTKSKGTDSITALNVFQSIPKSIFENTKKDPSIEQIKFVFSSQNMKKLNQEKKRLFKV